MGKNKLTHLKEENLLTLLSQNNFIIPEIQREYVWGENEKVILKFLNDLKNKIGSCCNQCNLPSSSNKINIGFLYSYKPDYVKIEHDRFLDENLIDGQQRFTTLFLLLFYCSLKELRGDGRNRKDEFLTLIRFEQKLRMCFDFKVRDLTKKFMLELIEKVDFVAQLNQIEQQTWFLKDYQSDVSIRSIIKALRFIQNVFSDGTKYYNHLINYVVFWHFKTEATSQGEELYITMNARGEELADNEVAKAALMVGDSEILKWGKKWEEWQHFFWKHRDKEDANQSADKGFNGFLSCIAGLEFYLKDKQGIAKEKDIQKLLTFERVEEFFSAFNLLIEKRKDFDKNYTYKAWVTGCLSEIWSIINKNETDWFADYQDKNKSTERNRMVFVWSWLYYIVKKRGDNKTIDTFELFRVLRFFFVRYHNNNRSVSTLQNTIDDIIEKGIFMSPYQTVDTGVFNPEEETDTKLRTIEESIKYFYLSNKKDDLSFKDLEELIWEIEDHPLNLDGSDVGNINITHLIELNHSVSKENLEEIKKAFFALFPKQTKTGSPILKTILLFYGEFWEDTSYYFKRFDFSDWRRNIREPKFKVLLKELFNDTTDTLLSRLQTEFIDNHKEEIKSASIVLPAGYTLSQKLAFYSLLLNSDQLWAEGEKVIICNKINSLRLFEDENEIIYNSKGTFKGNTGNSDLWKIVRKRLDNPLAELKKRIKP